MPTTTNVAQVKLNVMTKAQYDAATKVPTELYAVTDGGAVDEIIEFQQPTSSNNYTWYRKYKSGWVEQGQCRVATADQVIQITFPVEMADEYYVWSIGRHIYQVSPQTANEAFMGITNRTTTGFQITDRWGHTYAWCWQVSGMAA